MKARLAYILLAAFGSGLVFHREGLFPRFELPTGGVTVSRVLAAADTGRCNSTLATAGVRYLKKVTNALARCHKARLNGRLAPGENCSLTGQLPERISSIIVRARAQLAGQVCGACSPDDGQCGVGTDDVDPAVLGWPAVCPGFEDLGCGNATTTLPGVLSCAECITDAAVGQLLELVYTQQPADPACVRKAGKAVARYLKRVALAIRRCRGREAGGSLAPGATCLLGDPNLDHMTIEKIAGAAATKDQSICAGCGGDDMRCDGSGDVGVGQYGFPDSCPDVAECSRSITGLADIVACSDCVADFKAACATSLLYEPSRMSPLCASGTCGNGVRNFGEACDPPDDLACPGRCGSDCSCLVTPTSTTGMATPTATPTSSLPPPFITDFNPKSGSIGDTVAIAGGNFATPSGPGPQVTLNAQGGGTITAPVAAFTATSITIVIPAGAASGFLTVTLGGHSATSAGVLTIRPASDFTLTALPGSGNVILGQSISYAVSLGSTNGFSQLASLSVSGLPAGLSASFDRSLITAGQTSLLTLTAPANQPLGTTSFTVTASATVQGIPEVQSASVGVTVQPATRSLLGRTVVADAIETPLAGVTVRFLGKDLDGDPTGCAVQTQSDAAGNFMMTGLPSACGGFQLVRYDGSTATTPAGNYAGVDLLYYFRLGQVTTPPVLIHLPRIDDAETVMVQQNAPADQTFTFRTIPFLSVTVYAGTVLTLADGSQPNPFPLIAVQVPVDRLPDEMPDDTKVMAFIVAFQPANATASQPIAVAFPNTLNSPPGANLGLSTLDPTQGVMVVYGSGTVSSDGTQIIPDPDPNYPGRRYGLVHFDWHGPRQTPNSDDPSPDCLARLLATVGCSVDLSSGLEVHTSTDIAINGLLGPVSIVRTYRTRSTNPGPFGVGTNHNYGYQLDIAALQQGQGVINLVMPDGNRLPFNLQPDGTFACSTIPALRGVVVSRTATGYAMRWRDGQAFEFQTLGIQTLLTSTTDPNGNQITLVRSPPLFSVTSILDAVGRALTLMYDGANRIIAIADPIGRTVQYTYNGQGTLETFTNAEGGVTRYTYDGQNRLTQVTDARGVAETRLVYDQNDRVIQEIRPDGGVMSFDYELLNPRLPALSPILLTTVTDALGHRTFYRFSPEGMLLSMTDATGQARVFERESGTNLLLAERGVAGCPVCGGQAAGDRSFSYDANGNTLTSTDALGNTTAYTYEPTSNKLASVTDPLGHVTSFTYDRRGKLLSAIGPSGETTVFDYDETGLLTSVTDAIGHVGLLKYDHLGNLVAATDPSGNTRRFSHDAVSRLTAVTDPRGRATHYSYDGLDRVIAVTNPMNETIQFAYDETGNLEYVIDALAHTTTFDYDSRNRPIRRTDPAGRVESFDYDLAGNLTRYADRKGQITRFEYDVANRLLSKNYADGTAVDLTRDSRGRIVRAFDSVGGAIVRAYDPLDRLTREIGSTGSVVYAYDALGRRASLTVSGQAPVTYAYDANSRVAEVVQNGNTTHLTYDALGRRTSLEFPNGVRTSYTYDDASRITELLYQNGGAVLGDLAYNYDAAGNRSQVSGSFGRTLLPAPLPSASYDSMNRQLQFGTNATTFDPNGNVDTRVDPAGVMTFTWNARGQLANVESSTATVAFTYDAFGRRTGKEVNGRLTSYLYDRADSVEELTNGTVIGILRGPWSDEVLLRGGTEYYLANAIGSVVALTDMSGVIRSQHTYDPYGMTQVDGATSNTFQYTGRERDETGLYYYRARYYDPIAARFISEDPIRFLGGDVNLYTYVSGNPISARDPSGLSEWYEDAGNWVGGAVSDAYDYTTSQAQSSAEYWANLANDPNASFLEHAIANVAGPLAELATKQNLPCTAAVLAGGLVAGGAAASLGGPTLGELGAAASSGGEATGLFSIVLEASGHHYVMIAYSAGAAAAGVGTVGYLGTHIVLKKLGCQ